MLTSTQRETREFNYQRHGLLCNFARLSTKQAMSIKRSFEYHFGDREETTVSGINLFVEGLLLTVKAPSPDHNFIVVDEPSAEVKELFAAETANAAR